MVKTVNAYCTSQTDNDQVLYREQLEKDLVSAKVALQERVGENVVSTPNSSQLDSEVCIHMCINWS